MGFGAFLRTLREWEEEEKDMQYETDIILGEKYRDDQTGIEGTAVSVTFFQYACERVGIELVVNGEIKEYVFDSPRLTEVKTGKRAESEKTGGPGRGWAPSRPSSLGR